jgi:hypothetical protein
MDDRLSGGELGHDRTLGAENAGAYVECYSGHTYAGEPRAVTWQGKRYPVAQVEARWRTPAGPTFRVRTQPGARFDLWYHEPEDRWSVARLEATPHPSPVFGDIAESEPYEDKEALD